MCGLVVGDAFRRLVARSLVRHVTDGFLGSLHAFPVFYRATGSHRAGPRATVLSVDVIGNCDHCSRQVMLDGFRERADLPSLLPSARQFYGANSQYSWTDVDEHVIPRGREESKVTHECLLCILLRSTQPSSHFQPIWSPERLCSLSSTMCISLRRHTACGRCTMRCRRPCGSIPGCGQNVHLERGRRGARRHFGPSRAGIPPEHKRPTFTYASLPRWRRPGRCETTQSRPFMDVEGLTASACLPTVRVGTAAAHCGCRARRRCYSCYTSGQRLRTGRRWCRRVEEGGAPGFAACPGSRGVCTTRNLENSSLLRKLGRPRQTWNKELLKLAVDICGSIKIICDIRRKPSEKMATLATRRFCVCIREFSTSVKLELAGSAHVSHVCE